MAKIILGLSSSVSVYKSMDIVSHFTKNGHEVYPILTENAAKLISPRLFASIAGQPASAGRFEEHGDQAMPHIDLARQADLMLIAPATANVISKLAAGIADDLLTTTALAIDCPLAVAPAMNPRMWAKPIIQENVKRLQDRGVCVIGPVSGRVACGDEGTGRLAEISDIISLAEDLLSANKKTEKSPLGGKKVLITAGGSREPLDPVRVLTNLSSGKMASALAEKLTSLGAEVTYLYGAVSVPVPRVFDSVQFTTTEDLLARMQELIAGHDIVIMAAAPGDYRPREFSASKIKKNGALVLDLVRTPDVLNSLPRRDDQLVVGFAAETDDLIANASKKLREKKLDLVVANPAAGSEDGVDFGIGQDNNRISILDRDGVIYESPVIDKKTAAEKIIREIENRL